MNSHWLLLSALALGSVWSRFEAGAGWGRQAGSNASGPELLGWCFSLSTFATPTTGTTEPVSYATKWRISCRFHAETKAPLGLQVTAVICKGTEVQAPRSCSSSRGLGIWPLRLLGWAIWTLTSRGKKRIINNIALHRTIESITVECILQFIHMGYWFLFSLSLQCWGVSSICH